jgi:hypothetical protein
MPQSDQWYRSQTAIQRRNEALQKIMLVYIMSSNTEQELRRMWSLSQAVFTGHSHGLLVRLEKAKAKRKLDLRLPLTPRDVELLPEWTTADDVISETSLADQQTIEAAEMEGNINDENNSVGLL